MFEMYFKAAARSASGLADFYCKSKNILIIPSWLFPVKQDDYFMAERKPGFSVKFNGNHLARLLRMILSSLLVPCGRFGFPGDG